MFCRDRSYVHSLKCFSCKGKLVDIDLQDELHKFMSEKSSKDSDLYNSNCHHIKMDDLMSKFCERLNNKNVCVDTFFGKCKNEKCKKLHFYTNKKKKKQKIFKVCHVCSILDNFWNSKFEPEEVIFSKYNNDKIVGEIYILILNKLKENKDFVYKMSKKWNSHISQDGLETDEIFFESTFDSLKIINRIRFWLYFRIKNDFLKLDNYDDLAIELFKFKNYKCFPRNAKKLAKAIYNKKKDNSCGNNCINIKNYCHGNKPNIRQLVDGLMFGDEFNLSVKRLKFISKVHELASNRKKKIYGISNLTNLIINYYEPFKRERFITIVDYLYKFLPKKDGINPTLNEGAFKKFKPNLIRTQSDDSVCSDSSDISLDLTSVNPVISIKSSPRAYVIEDISTMKKISKLRIDDIFSKLEKRFKNLYKKIYSSYKKRIINDGNIDEIIKILEFYVESNTRKFVKNISSLNNYKYGSVKSFYNFKEYFENNMYPELSDFRNFGHNFDKERNISIKDSTHVLRSFYKLDNGNFLSGFEIKRKIPYLFDLYVSDCSLNLGFNQFTTWIDNDFKWKKIIQIVFQEKNLTETKFNRILRMINDSPNKISFIPRIVDIPVYDKKKNKKNDIIKLINNNNQINILLKNDLFAISFDTKILNSKIIGRTTRKAIINNLENDCNNLKEKISECDPKHSFIMKRTNNNFEITINSKIFDFKDNYKLINNIISNLFYNLSYFYRTSWNNYDTCQVKTYLVSNQSSFELETIKTLLKLRYSGIKADLTEEKITEINDMEFDFDKIQYTLDKHLYKNMIPKPYHWNNYFENLKVKYEYFS